MFVKFNCNSCATDETGVFSEGHDKPFCVKAITIIDKFKQALGNTDNR